MTVDPKAFWEAKILGWEEGRYDLAARGDGWLERMADRASASLRFRLRIAGELLAPHVAGKRVVELGCGSGRLVPGVMAAGAQSYLGIDIAEAAIAAAHGRAFAGEVTFVQGGIGAIPQGGADIVFSLGVLDWLTDPELVEMFERSGSADFLHAIAVRRLTPAQLIHRLYVHVAYGHRTGSYRPRYFLPAEIAAMAQAVAARPVYIYDDPRLSFGAILSSLPIGPEVR